MRPLVICCLLSVLVLTLYIREGDSGMLHTARSVASTVTMPVRYIGSAIAAPFGAVGNAANNLTASEKTLSELKKENAELTAKVAELSESAKTAERLQDLMGLQSSYNLQSTAARIIGSTGDSWSNTVMIDKGSTSGIELGMPVCNSGGVIGQVIEVSAATSTVRLITDDASSVSAMVQSTRAQGMLQGQPDGTLRLAYVPTDADVKVGDIIITSGLGGAFPKGLPLGTVTSVERASNDVYYTIVVRGISSAETNEEVLVITSLGSDQVASAEEVAAANTSPQGGSSTDQASSDNADAAATDTTDQQTGEGN